MTFSALDDVLRTASSVRVSEIDWYGEIVVDLTRVGVLDGLRAAVAVESLSGAVCACTGQARFGFFGAQGERITEVVLHGSSAIDWHGYDGFAGLPDDLLLRWLEEHGMPNPLRSGRERPEWRAWEAAIPPALEEMAGDLVGHWPMAADSKHVIEACERMRSVGSVIGVLQLLAWCAAGIGNQAKSPPYEDVPGLVLRDVPIAEIVAALQDPKADERHDAGAARILLVDKSRIKQRMYVARLPGPLKVRVREAAAARDYELPQWAERLLLSA